MTLMSDISWLAGIVAVESVVNGMMICKSDAVGMIEVGSSGAFMSTAKLVPPEFNGGETTEGVETVPISTKELAPETSGSAEEGPNRSKAVVRLERSFATSELNGKAGIVTGCVADTTELPGWSPATNPCSAGRPMRPRLLDEAKTSSAPVAPKSALRGGKVTMEPRSTVCAELESSGDART